MKGDLGKLMQQARKMQADMKKAQEELAQTEVVGESGGGMVRVHMNGRHEVRRVEIDASLIGDDKDMLEDLIAAACNDAVSRVAAEVRDRFAGMAGTVPGLNLPF